MWQDAGVTWYVFPFSPLQGYQSWLGRFWNRYQSLSNNVEFWNQCWPESSLQCEKIVCWLSICIFLWYSFSKFMCSISIVVVISCWCALMDRDCVVDMRRDVQEIFKLTPHDKQVMMFSATLSKEIRPVCKRFMQDVMSCSQLIPLLV
jgi:hypothetical protein